MESIKIRKITANEHVLASERVGPLLSGYIRASEASLASAASACTANCEQTCERVSVGGHSCL